MGLDWGSLESQLSHLLGLLSQVQASLSDPMCREDGSLERQLYILQDSTSSLTENRTSFTAVCCLESDLQWLEFVCKFIPKLTTVTRGMSRSNWSRLHDSAGPGDKDEVSTCRSKWNEMEKMGNSSEGEENNQSSIAPRGRSNSKTSRTGE